MSKPDKVLVPVPLGLNGWVFEIWRLWCHSLSPSIRLPSAGEMHQSENRLEVSASFHLSLIIQQHD